ncbi:MAG: sigma 54-interacting transcriptional regulator, partial [Betaproteobacteria bacterium]|nr:sigma 54-interacting transcriptional regulator [Betaproteobacteria bacterium]
LLAVEEPAPQPVRVDSAELPRDARLREDFTRALRAFGAGVPVLVRGETGSGKEVAARALHRLGRRADAPWMAVNCGAMAPELVASELFGHADGAFTGSVRGGRAGVFEAAHGGTVFLDEIGDMPLHLQVALLRVLDNSEVIRVGSTRPMRVDVAVICATHRDLQAMVREGAFREDLYYRLAGYTLRLPALRERGDFDHVLDQVLADLGSAPGCVDQELRALLRAHDWPGNVRELRHVLRVALALAEDPRRLQLHELRLERAQAPVADLPRRLAHDEPNPQDSRDAAPLPWRRQQAQAIDQALARCGGDINRAAALLGISRATLYRRLKERRG